MLGLPAITDLGSLADETALSRGLLYKLAVVSGNFYHRFEIPKKSGGVRTILNPSREMKAVQAWILRNVLDHVHIHEAATGFRRGFSTLQNATPHLKNRYFVCLDIQDFFPSITYPKVYNVFRTLGYNAHMAHVFSQICTCDGRLPQGAVTSPALSNIVCIRLDRRISAFVGRRNIAYTRYADDLTFSAMSPNWLVAAMPTIRHIVEDQGFSLNVAKTRLMGPGQQRRVTGLVLGDGQVGVGRKQKRKLRAAIHHLLLEGANEAGHAAKEAHVLGWCALLNSVDRQGLAQLRSYAGSLARKYGVRNAIAK